LGTTNYLYDGLNPIQELAGTTPTANLLVGGIDEYFQRTDSNGPANFLTDALGNTLALTDPAGNTVAQYTYEPFGNTTITGTSANPYQYTGRENDAPGAYFYRNRYYSATFQRFISEDPIGIAGGINLYGYTGNNPVSFRDPFGTDKCQAFYCDPNLWLAAGTIVLTLALPEVGALEFAAEAGEGFEAAEAAAETAEAGASVGEETVTGYRAVSPAEWNDVASSSQFKPSPYGGEVKYFSNTPEQAYSFGDRMYGPGNYGVVQGDFPASAVGGTINPATEGPGFFVENPNLPAGTPTGLTPPTPPE